MTPILQKLANLFPFTMQKTPDPNTLELLESFLPTKERAWSLSESYLLHGAYFFRPVKRDELLNTMIPTIYNAASERVRARVNSDASSPNSDKLYEAACDGYSPHTLATLFFVFALGALLDLNLPPYNAEAEQYYQLGRAALSLRSAFDSPQIDTIQAIGFMATYHTSGGKKYTRDSAVRPFYLSTSLIFSHNRCAVVSNELCGKTSAERMFSYISPSGWSSRFYIF